jgi:hypothetical protein
MQHFVTPNLPSIVLKRTRTIPAVTLHNNSIKYKGSTHMTPKKKKRQNLKNQSHTQKSRQLLCDNSDFWFKLISTFACILAF